jgi:hypothetical protein
MSLTGVTFGVLCGSRGLIHLIEHRTEHAKPPGADPAKTGCRMTDIIRGRGRYSGNRGDIEASCRPSTRLDE